MEQTKNSSETEKYIEVPCGNCGLHYWKIPSRDGRQFLVCPKCKQTTRIEIGKQLNIYSN